MKVDIKMKISELNKLGFNFEIINDVEINLLGMATTKYAEEKVLSFLSDGKYIESIFNNKNITAVVCNKKILENMELPSKLGIILSDTPKKDFILIHNKLVEEEFYWKKFPNEISEDADISEHAIISEHSIKIGKNCTIEPGVIIFSGTIIGDDVIIRSGSQIGTNGFQFIKNGEDVIPVKTGGRAIIKDRVEIQHNCCVDRGVFGGPTILDEDVKLASFSHIEHDNYIGKRAFIAAGVITGGRVNIGKDCWVGINATISNGINIGDNCKISLGSVVTKDVESNKTVSGNFAIEHEKFIEFIKSIR